MTDQDTYNYRIFNGQGEFEDFANGLREKYCREKRDLPLQCIE